MKNENHHRSQKRKYINKEYEMNHARGHIASLCSGGHPPPLSLHSFFIKRAKRKGRDSEFTTIERSMKCEDKPGKAKRVDQGIKEMFIDNNRSDLTKGALECIRSDPHYRPEPEARSNLDVGLELKSILESRKSQGLRRMLINMVSRRDAEKPQEEFFSL